MNDSNPSQLDEGVKISYSESVMEFIYSHNSSQQKIFTEEFVKIYGKALRFLVINRLQTYMPTNDIQFINMLAAKEVTICICDRIFHVQICHDTFTWYIYKVGGFAKDSIYEVSKIPTP